MNLQYIFLIFLLQVNPITAYPFNSSFCASCISKINFLQHDNATQKDISNLELGVLNFCDEFNISGCQEAIASERRWLHQPAVKICEQLDFCDSLNYENMILNISPGLSLYYYYDLVIALQDNFNMDTGMVNHTELWSFKIPEPYISADMISLYNDSYYTCSCYICVNERQNTTNSDCYNQIKILKLRTSNYIYYVNTDNGVVLAQIQINNLLGNYKFGHSGMYSYLPTQPAFNNTLYDVNYNGSLFFSEIIFEMEKGTCQSPSSLCFHLVNPRIKIKNLESIFPQQKPRCGLALQMYCPRNFINREMCLKCVIQNQNIFSVCSIQEEEDWCNYVN